MSPCARRTPSAHHADIVHYHGVGPALLSWAPDRRGVGALATVHGRDWQRPKWGGAASLALRAGEWMSMHAPDETVVVSRSLASELSDRYGRPVALHPQRDHAGNGDDLGILDELGRRAAAATSCSPLAWCPRRAPTIWPRPGAARTAT